MDWVYPWIGLDWIGLDWVGSNFLLKNLDWIGFGWLRSFVRFIVFTKTEAFAFVKMHFWFSSQLVIGL